MEEVNKKSIIIKILLIIIFIAAAYFYIVGFPKKEETNKTDTNEDITDNLKINKDLDYVYFEDTNLSGEEINIEYRYPIININSDDAKNLQETIHKELDKRKDSIKYDDSEETALICSDNVVYAEAFDVEYTQYKQYVSILTTEYEYNCPSEGNTLSPSAYTFDVTTGKILELDEILKVYSLTTEDINVKLKAYLQEISSSLARDSEALIDYIHVSETLNNIELNKTLSIYIDNSGVLTANLVVITDKLNYNEIIKLS